MKEFLKENFVQILIGIVAVFSIASLASAQVSSMSWIRRIGTGLVTMPTGLSIGTSFIPISAVYTNKAVISNLGTPAGSVIAVNPSGQIIATSTSSGAVSSVTAPLVLSGTDVSIPVATSLVNGYLSSTDWSTFNAKQPAGAYLTSETDPVYVASPASGITTTDITNLSNLSGTNTGDQNLTPYALLSGASFSGNVAIPALGTPAGTFLAVNGSGVIIATTTSSGGVVSVNGTYPILSTGGTNPIISTAFSTTTSNFWGGTQSFNIASIPTLGTASGSFIAVDPTGQMIATTTPSGGGSPAGINASINVETLTANKTLVAGTDAMYQYLDTNGAARTITLDTASASAGDRFVVKNNDSYNEGYFLAIQQGTTALDTIYAGSSKVFIFDGTNWKGADNGVQNDNIAIGHGASGYGHGIAIGYNAYSSSQGTGVGFGETSYSNGVAFGYYTKGQTYGTALGYYANGSSHGTALGYYAGNGQSGSYNINIGQNVTSPTLSGSQQLNIGNLLYGIGIYGGASVSSVPVIGGKIGIGTTTPDAKLSVVGNGVFTGKLTGNGVNAGINVQTLTANITLNSDTDPMYQYLNPNGATRAINLATSTTVKAGDRFMIKNTDTLTSLDELQILQGNSLLLDLIPAGTIKGFVFDGTNWVGGTNGSVDPNVSIGPSSDGTYYGTSVGANSLGTQEGSVVGYNAQAVTLGAAIGIGSVGNNYGSSVGAYAGNGQSGYFNINIGQYVTSPVLAGNQQLNIGNVLYGTGMYNGSSVSSVPVIGGNIGIGTTTPTQKLVVDGGIQAKAGLPGGNNVNGTGYSFSTPGDTDGGMFSDANGTLKFLTNSVTAVTIDPNQNMSVAGTINTGGYTVATLPTGVFGMRAYVTDAVAPTYLGTLTGGGTVTVPVFFDGGLWRSD